MGADEERENATLINRGGDERERKEKEAKRRYESGGERDEGQKVGKKEVRTR